MKNAESGEGHRDEDFKNIIRRREDKTMQPSARLAMVERWIKRIGLRNSDLPEEENRTQKER